MKSVLFLISLYKPNVGGVENSVSELAKEFLEAGYAVKIVCSNRDFVLNSKLDDFELMDGAEVYRYDYPQGAFGFLKQFYNCFRVIRNNELQCSAVIISRSPIPLISGFLAGARGIKYIVPSVYLFQEKRTIVRSGTRVLSYLASFLLQAFAFFLSRTYVFSESMQNQVRKASFGFVPPKVLKPGVSKKRFYPPSKHRKEQLRLEYGIPVKAKVVLGLGRFSEMKQFDQVIQSAQFWDCDSLLVLVGDGPELLRYKILIDEFDLNKKVIIFPSTPAPERYFQLSDVFVMTSRYEAFGQVLLEATSCGLPVVAYPNSSGVRTSVPKIYEGYQSLVRFSESTNPLSLGRKINEVLNEKRSPLFVEESERFISEYSWASLAKALLE